MYQWHLTKRYSDNSHVLWLVQIQSPWPIMKQLGLLLYIFFNLVYER